MKKTMRRDRVDDALSFLEYLLLAVLVIAAAVASMTFLGTTDGRGGSPGSPSTNSLRLRVAGTDRSLLGVVRVQRSPVSPGSDSPLALPIAGRTES